MPSTETEASRVNSGSSSSSRGAANSNRIRPWSSHSKGKPKRDGKRLVKDTLNGNSRPKSAASAGQSENVKKGISAPSTSRSQTSKNIKNTVTDTQKAPASSRKVKNQWVNHSTSSHSNNSVLITQLSNGTKPWSVTELPDGDDLPEDLDDSLSDEDEDGTPSSSFIQQDLPLLPNASKPLGVAGKSTALQAWLDGPRSDSEDYDTDLEDDFPPGPEKPSDPTGKYYYEEKCKKEGIVPVSYLMRHMGERNIRMRHHYLGGEASKPMAAAFKRNTIVEMMDLSDNYLEGDGAVSLADMLKENMFITNLNISNNFIRSKGAEAVAEMLDSNTTLKTLTLQGNQLNDNDAKYLAEALKNNVTLANLDLSNNEFGETGGMHLAAGLLANEGLNDLDLSWNSIRQKGAVSIINALKANTSLEVLDLSWNGLSLLGALALQKILKINTTLKVLDISNNRMDSESAKKLAQGVSKNTGLETLLLNFNPIKEAGMEAILKAVSANGNIKLLGIEGCLDITISPAIYEKIKELEESSNIVILYSRTGGVQPSRAHSSVMRLFDKFITTNKTRLEDLFTQLDKDRSGDITLEELKYGLRESGFRLTNKQLDILLNEIDLDKNGTIEYEELLNGELLLKRERRKAFLDARDYELYARARRSHLVAKKPPENVATIVT